MEIIVSGKNIKLSQNQFVARGGEAMIFNSGDIAFKIYEDLNKMIPESKLKELSKLAIPNIVAPLELVYNRKKEIVGFTMRWLGNDKVALCKLFVNKFRNKNNITDNHSLELIENIKEKTTYIHQNGFLIVDGNDLNYMVDTDWVTPYFIDVNSWQTPNFPATAIMDSIRDFKSDKFSQLTDWFSFAIISFQIFVGIHPFKGKHKDYKNGDFKSRIKDCISVLNPKVKTPPNVRDFGIIPNSYMDWYLNLFEKGKREPPPTQGGNLGQVKTRLILVKSTDNFEIKELHSFNSKILFHKVFSGTEITKTQNHLYLGKQQYKVSDGVEVLFTPMEGIPIFIKIENERLKLHSPNNYYQIKDINIKCEEILIVNNILYVKNNSKLIELSVNLMNTNTIVFSIKTPWEIQNKSSQIFSNVIFQSLLGKAFVSIPLPTYNKSKFIYFKFSELDTYRILDGKYQGRVLMFNIHKNGEYGKATIIFNKDHTEYKIDIKMGIDYVPVNFIVLDNGICISITEESAVEIFLNSIDKPDIKRIEDPQINSEMILCNDGTQVRFISENKIFSMKMK